MFWVLNSSINIQIVQIKIPKIKLGVVRLPGGSHLNILLVLGVTGVHTKGLASFPSPTSSTNVVLMRYIIWFVLSIKQR